MSKISLTNRKRRVSKRKKRRVSKRCYFGGKKTEKCGRCLGADWIPHREDCPLNCSQMSNNEDVRLHKLYLSIDSEGKLRSVNRRSSSVSLIISEDELLSLLLYNENDKYGFEIQEKLKDFGMKYFTNLNVENVNNILLYFFAQNPDLPFGKDLESWRERLNDFINSLDRESNFYKLYNQYLDEMRNKAFLKKLFVNPFNK